MLNRFTELLKEADENASNKMITDYEDAIKDKAEFLLFNGVIVLPCKVGDLIRFRDYYLPWKVLAIHIYAEGIPQISVTGCGLTSTMSINEFYKTCSVLTKEEAENRMK